MESMAEIKSQVPLSDYADKVLTRRGRATYNCPICGSGTGPNGSPAFKVNEKINRWKCFSCDKSGDIFDLAGIVNNTEDKREQLQIVADWAGIPLEEGQTYRKPEIKPQPVKDYSQGIAAEAAKVKEWQQNIEDPDAIAYLEKRGLTLQQARDFGLGYDMQRRCIVIPYPGNEYYHIDRMTWTDEQGKKVRKPDGEKVGSEPIFNPGAIEKEPLFLVEGPLDALSCMACGFPAIALCSSNSRNVESFLVSHEYRGAVVVALDNEEDSKGPKHQRELVKTLQESGIWAVGAEYPENWPYKDFSEAYKADRERLGTFLGGNVMQGCNG